MILSEIAVKRPVLASVFSLLLVVFGLMSMDRLSLREYPDINPPVVSITTDYPGASAQIVENQITRPIEDRVSGVEGIKWMQSSSADGRSRVTIEFHIDQDIDAAANDVREAISRVIRQLPDEADPPQVTKADANADVIMWFNLASTTMDRLALTDYAERYLVDRFSVLDGVALVRVGAAKRPALRITLDRQALAARGLTVQDVEQALRRENVELPAGRVESIERELTVRVDRSFRDVESFERMVIAEGADGHLVRLGEVANVAIGAEDDRNDLRGNTVPQVGLGIIQQSTANTLEVARLAKAEAERIRQILPEGTELLDSYDSSVFVEGAIAEVYTTLAIAGVAVVFVIFLFLGSLRATLVPAVTVPISLIASFMVLHALGFSINLLTLLALVLAIGLVVDDAIVMLENIDRRIGQGEPPLLAAFRGSKQVGFAIVATTLVLISVFVPLAFLEGNIGRLFTEFAFAMAAAVAFSSLVALTLSPVMCAALLKRETGGFARLISSFFGLLERGYGVLVHHLLKVSALVLLALVGVFFLMFTLFEHIPDEYAPQEDRGAFFVFATAEQGTGYTAMRGKMLDIESRLMPLVDSGEIDRLLIRTPRGFGNTEIANNGIVIIVLEHWHDRDRSAWQIMAEVRQRLSDLPGLRIGTVMRQGLGGRRLGDPVQFVLGGSTYEELIAWRDIMIEKAAEYPELGPLDSDLKETKPQLLVTIDTERAGDLGVSVETIGRTLEAMLNYRTVTTFTDRGEEYDVRLEGDVEQRRSPQDIQNVFVRSDRSGELIPLSNLVQIEETSTSPELNRYNRARAVTLSASVSDGYTLGQALDRLEQIAATELPESARIDYKGESLEYKQAGGAVIFVFLLALAVVFLVLAAQFESFIHPLVIMLTVPLAVAGALLGLYWTGQSLNIYSQIGIVMLIGLAAKNGILIVEFANQLRDAGRNIREATVEAARLRLRPVLMTAMTTMIGALPLVYAFGPGAESRYVLGIVILSGILFATVFTLLVIPSAYYLIGRFAGAPGDQARRLAEQARASGDAKM